MVSKMADTAQPRRRPLIGTERPGESLDGIAFQDGVRKEDSLDGRDLSFSSKSR